MAAAIQSAFLTSLDPLLMQPQYAIGQKNLVIGRDAEKCQVVLSREYVSRVHCSVMLESGDFWLVDGGSTNGTYVNGARINRHALSEGDKIGLGNAQAVHFEFTCSGRPRQKERLLPSKPAYSIGRLPDNDLPLSNDTTVSSHHARVIVRAGTQLLLEDLGSSNGTFVNGQQISRQSIGPDDVVLIGSSELQLRLSQRGLEVLLLDRKNRVQIEARNLWRTSRGVSILKDVSLVIEPGEYVGVLGPSGAGKSTLLNALCGFQPANRGDVLLNGQSLYRSYDMLRNSIGYVPQDDIIHPDLNVERSLAYTAQLRLPSDTSDTQMGQIVTSAVETLGLSHVRQNPITRLSGGQRKRVSIGCELLTRPSLVFLDEPTSGLDPCTEEKLMKYFAQMAQQGQSVILTTHVLYNLDLLHLVTIMARGRLVYFGPVSEICQFFHSESKPVSRPLDIFDALEPDPQAGSAFRDQVAEEFEKKYRDSRLFAEYVAGRAKTPLSPNGSPPVVTTGSRAATNPQSRSKKSFSRRVKEFLDIHQFIILLKRVLDIKLSSLSRLIVPIAAPIILALLTSTIPFESSGPGGAMGGVMALPIPISFPLMLTMTAVFLGTLAACLEISGERPIYLRERSVNLQIHLYAVSKLPYLFLLSLVQCFLYVFIIYFIKDLGSIDVLQLALIATALACVSAMVGLFISSLDPTPGNNSVILAVIAVLPQLILCGAMAPKFYHGMPNAAKALAAVLPARWGFEMLLTTVYQEPSWARDVITGTDLGQMGFDFGNQVFLHNLSALAVLAVVFFLATCISLKRYDRL